MPTKKERKDLGRRQYAHSDRLLVARAPRYVHIRGSHRKKENENEKENKNDDQKVRKKE